MTKLEISEEAIDRAIDAQLCEACKDYDLPDSEYPCNDCYADADLKDGDWFEAEEDKALIGKRMMAQLAAREGVAEKTKRKKKVN